MELYKHPWQPNSMIRRTYLQAFGVCIIGAFFINTFMANGMDVLAKTYDTVRVMNLDMLHKTMLVDGTFGNEDAMVCGNELNVRLHDLLQWYASDPNGLNIPWCDDGFAFVPFVDGAGGVLITVVEDLDNANFNHAYNFKVTSKKIAISSICKNGNCDEIVDDEADHAGYYAKIISL